MKHLTGKPMIKIRMMVPQDRQFIYNILQETNMFTLSEINVALELIDTYLFNKQQKDYIIYVAEDSSNEVVGYICFGATPATVGTFDIYWIAVSPSVQGKGFGKQLLFYAENQVIEHKGRLIIIETSSKEDYFPTRKFYLNNNYEIVAQIKDFYRPKDDRVIFAKYISKQKGGQ